MVPLTSLGERLGTALGWLLSPTFAVTSWARQARTFHPTGYVFLARVEPLATGGALGASLRGPALVRFSGALWKRTQERFEVLGCAIRFRRSSEPSADAATEDQDLLLATIRRPWTLPLAPFTTDARDFLANEYFGVSPFDAPVFGRCYFRLTPLVPGGGTVGTNRAERLRHAVVTGQAKLRLEVRRMHERAWTPVAQIDVREPVVIDQARLRFWPFRSGRQIEPRGFIQSLRRGAYTASQLARPSHTAQVTSEAIAESAPRPVRPRSADGVVSAHATK